MKEYSLKMQFAFVLVLDCAKPPSVFSGAEWRGFILGVWNGKMREDLITCAVSDLIGCLLPTFLSPESHQSLPSAGKQSHAFNHVPHTHTHTKKVTGGFFDCIV